METGKPDAGKSIDEDGHLGGEDDTRIGEDDNWGGGGGGDYDGRDVDRDRAWAEFRDRALRNRDRYLDSRGRYERRDQGCFERDFYGCGGCDYDRDFYERGGRDYDGHWGRDYEEHGVYDDCGSRGRDYDRAGRDSGRGDREYDYDTRAFDRGGRFRGVPDGRREPHRLPKIPFPTFNGDSDPLTWLNKFDNYFRGHRVPEDEKVWTASLHLDGTAAEWYYQMERDFGMVSWPRFVEFVNLRFGPPIGSNSIGEIKALFCTSTVEEYSRRYLALLSHCDHLSTRTKIDLYTGGVGQPLASDEETAPCQSATGNEFGAGV